MRKMFIFNSNKANYCEVQQHSEHLWSSTFRIRFRRKCCEPCGKFQLIAQHLPNSLFMLLINALCRTASLQKDLHSPSQNVLTLIDILKSSFLLITSLLYTFKALAFIVIYHSFTKSWQVTYQLYVNRVTSEFSSMIKSLISWRCFVILYFFDFLLFLFIQFQFHNLVKNFF